MKVAPLLVPVGVGFSCLPPGVEGEGAALCVLLLLGGGVVVLKLKTTKKKNMKCFIPNLASGSV